MVASIWQLDILFGNLGEMVEFQVEFLRTLEDGIKLVPDLDRLERVEQFKVSALLSLTLAALLQTCLVTLVKFMILLLPTESAVFLGRLLPLLC